MIISYICNVNGFESDLIGCFKNMPKNGSVYLANIQGDDHCIKSCYGTYYRYEIILNIFF